MGKTLIPPEPAEIHEVQLREALEERYLAYALSTIMHRALPDARDGLKPVHRRILYGMRLLRLDPGTPFKKSAKIVGDVMGSFHPHGDQSIYDALVRLAQDFSARYPLVDGQGNFGNIDGDNPAAYRYTEARMTEVARLLLDGIDEDGVEFRANYDGQSKEPIVLPGGFPNLLANGAQGIAVGMATAIPPHHAAELCDPELLMESLFRLTELESRIPLNLNVLVKGRIPKVLGLAECLKEWLDHLRDVLLRRSNHRKEQIEHRLEVLGGYLIAYLNIDKVIKIIRAEDEPKPALIKAFKLTDIQADAILNMRLRSLRKLEEFEIRTEDKNLRSELKGIKGILGSEAEQWAKVGDQVRKVRDIFGPKTPLGKRRTMFADAPQDDLAAIEQAFVEREPVTVVVSDKGWVRTLKGHVADLSGLTFKTDDKLDKAFFAETTSKLLLFATNGKFYSLDVAKLPGGRGHGEPIRMFVDMEQDAAIVSLFVNKGGRKFLIASLEGQGFVVNEDDCVGNTRKGKQVLNVEMPNEAKALATVVGDSVAVIGTNHKMVIFPIDQVPEMARGRGVRLQKYKGAGLSDVATFDSKAGLAWKDSAGREQAMSWKELTDWRGNRADAGRLAHGLPKSNKFGRGVE